MNNTQLKRIILEELRKVLNEDNYTVHMTAEALPPPPLNATGEKSDQSKISRCKAECMSMKSDKLALLFRESFKKLESGEFIRELQKTIKEAKSNRKDPYIIARFNNSQILNGIVLISKVSMCEENSQKGNDKLDTLLTIELQKAYKITSDSRSISPEFETLFQNIYYVFDSSIGKDCVERIKTLNKVIFMRQGNG